MGDSTNAREPEQPLVQDATLRFFLGYRLKRAYATLRADLLARLAPLGMRITTYSTLVLICDNPGLRQSAIANALEIKRSNMVAIVDDLEGKGWIERKRVANDRRAYALFPTQSGKRICKQATALNVEHESHVLELFSEDDLQSLSLLLEKIETSNAKKVGGETFAKK